MRGARRQNPTTLVLIYQAVARVPSFESDHAFPPLFLKRGKNEHKIRKTNTSIHKRKVVTIRQPSDIFFLESVVSCTGPTGTHSCTSSTDVRIPYLNTSKPYGASVVRN